jgi:hypothetical protein
MNKAPFSFCHPLRHRYILRLFVCALRAFSLYRKETETENGERIRQKTTKTATSSETTSGGGEVRPHSHWLSPHFLVFSFLALFQSQLDLIFFVEEVKVGTRRETRLD